MRASLLNTKRTYPFPRTCSRDVQHDIATISVRACPRVGVGGTHDICTAVFDWFKNKSGPNMYVIGLMCSQVEIQVTLPGGDGKERSFKVSRYR